MLKGLCRLHDGVTTLTFWAATAAVFYLTAVTALEVVSRYFFRAPTGWAPDTSAVAFAFIAFLAAPQLTRAQGHAAMTFVVEFAPRGVSLFMRRFSLLIAAVVCGFLAWFGGVESSRQIGQGVTMIAATPIPKYLVTVSITYGFASMAIYFVRQLAATLPSLQRQG